MLRVYCGDNFTESRNQFTQYKKECVHRGDECVEIRSANISEILNTLYGSASLFSTKRVFFSENILSKAIQRKALADCAKDPNIDIVTWETTALKRDISRSFPKATVIECSLPASLWSLLDGLRPGTTSRLIRDLTTVTQTTDEHAVLYMLQQRVKDLILVSAGQKPKRAQASWQISKLQSQAAEWKSQNTPATDRLLALQQKLFDIEVGVKSGQLTYPVRKALDIVFCFYVQ